MRIAGNTDRMYEVVQGLAVTALAGVFLLSVAERPRVQGRSASVRTANEYSVRVGRTTPVGLNYWFERSSRSKIFHIVRPTI